MSETTFTYQPQSRQPSLYADALKLKHGSRLNLIEQVQDGLPAEAFHDFARAIGLSIDSLSEIVGVSVRTVQRRLEAGSPLDSTISERLVRLARLYSRVTDVLSDEDLARQWMQTPREVFGGRTPLELARTELGAREVEDLLLRVEHGVFF